LGLKGPEVLNFGVVVNVRWKSIDIGKCNTDVSIRFDTIEGIAKG